MTRFLAISSLVVLAVVLSVQTASAEAVWAGIFGNRNLTVENPNDPTDAFNAGHYQMVLHVNSPSGYDAIEYSAERGWGFEVLNPGTTQRTTSFRFGPFDERPNDRDSFGDHLPNELYDSFIGFKNHPLICDAGVIGHPDRPCAPTIPASGGIFRIDVPNGTYRFVAVAGSADSNHVSRVLVEDGGSGPPADLDLGGANFAVLISNHDQARNDHPGLDFGGNFAAVGFDQFLPPEPVAPGVLPFFTNMDADGLPTVDAPDSPTLTVTKGFIRVHLLQGNSNAGVGGAPDSHGADLVLFEAHSVVIPPPGLGADLTRNGYVDADDLFVLLAHWNTLDGPKLGDLFIDPDPEKAGINSDDLFVLLANWTGPDPGPGGVAAPADTAVPEPSTLALSLLALLSLALRRRRNRTP